MKWLMTFLLGVLVGAGGLFAWLRQMPHEDAATAQVATGALPAPPGPSLEAQLPPAPKVTPDLTELDLPLRPASMDALTPAANAVPAVAPGKLMVPVDGIAFKQLSDTYDQPRGSERHHEALDILAPKGTKVFATADGKVAKLFTSKPGGLTVYQFDPTEKYAYYYAHLDRYAEGLQEGATVKRGDLIGYVGTTGNAAPDTPHLHFAVFELTPEKQWWKGTPVNPYPLLAE
ncbi:M23 family metallopeptidase [Massilia sp. YIM B02763]|uniref:M23 family metallopeptidase n=1 Tax=Massilia sp. YIM B02763 TaxID=3050130 RepID=UPI0025B6A4A2|nr:M23 family metallopeptidase [Massilia sp. YIM B02763]MDN4055938.1 M23 family metallopeptidase [Massilia sp. YIM B02763]